MAYASRSYVALAGSVATILITVTIVGAVVLDHPFVWSALLDHPEAPLGTALQEAWGDRYGDHFFDGIGLAFLIVPLTSLSLALLSTLVHFVNVHRTGSIVNSFGLAFRVATAGLWPLLFLVMAMLVIGSSDVLLAAAGFRYRLEWEDVIFSAAPFIGIALAAWTQRANAAASQPEPAIAIPPMCEGCGYDLTHQPADGRCPECGLSVDSSLRPGQRRPGSAWEIERNLRGWMMVTGAIIGKPRRFYGRLRLRTCFEAAGRFMISQIALIGIGACVWLIIMLAVSAGRIRPTPYGRILIPIVGGAMVSFIGWGLHRLLGAFVFLDWIRRKALPDFAWARKVFYYESAYLWVFCLFNGFFITWLIATDGKGLTDLLAQVGLRFTALGTPLEPAVMLAGNGLLCCLWVWRYYIALAAIRWSNY